ncbi:hypothetical protein HMPREF1980_01062 [Actinomyces sp. oral taxon 172 str. F0311]|nr:hypothetical protein HMPREF1980_01062 [Actinomyces sp. oral taxon 172 str. F0311]
MSLELQRFRVMFKVQSIELHATLLRMSPEASRLAVQRCTSRPRSLTRTWAR